MKKLRIFLISILSILAIIAVCLFGACAAEKYTVHYETFGGTEIKDAKVKKGGKISRPKNDPTKDMFEFVGWYEDEQLEKEFDFKKTKMPAGDLTVYAKWKSAVDSVRIFFDSKGGSEVDFKVGEIGSAYTAPENPVREGYTFGGWYTDSACTNLFALTVFPSQDITLYAKWNDDSSKYVYISYYGNGVLLQRVPVEKGATLEDPNLLPANVQTSGWFKDEMLTQEFALGGEAVENLELYTAYYTKGLEIANGVVIKFTPAATGNTTVYVPNVFEGKKVTAIGDDAFYASSEASNITKIVLPDTITKIGERAFYDCRNLTQINLTKNVTEVGKAAFHNNERLTDFGDISSLSEIADGTFLGCKKLAKVTLPQNLTAIGYQAFADCVLLESINIPSSVSFIDANAFENCKKLTQITLPAGLALLGNNAFKGCTSLKKVYVPAAELEQFKTKFGKLTVTDDVLLEDLFAAIAA